jgi:hypothetical protein
MVPTIAWAAESAEELLKDLGNRRAHVQGVAKRAIEISRVVPPDDRPYLVAAAYLHDIGYAAVLRRTGLHQLDGAAHLRQLGRERLARLVAHHSEARFEVEVRGAGHLLADYEPDEQSVRDALTYCDMTTSSTGTRTTLTSRLVEIEARYGESSEPAARQILVALERSLPHLKKAVESTERRIHALLASGSREPMR